MANAAGILAPSLSLEDRLAVALRGTRGRVTRGALQVFDPIAVVVIIYQRGAVVYP